MNRDIGATAVHLPTSPQVVRTDSIATASIDSMDQKDSDKPPTAPTIQRKPVFDHISTLVSQSSKETARRRVKSTDTKPGDNNTNQKTAKPYDIQFPQLMRMGEGHNDHASQAAELNTPTRPSTTRRQSPNHRKTKSFTGDQLSANNRIVLKEATTSSPAQNPETLGGLYARLPESRNILMSLNSQLDELLLDIRESELFDDRFSFFNMDVGKLSEAVGALVDNPEDIEVRYDTVLSELVSLASKKVARFKRAYKGFIHGLQDTYGEQLHNLSQTVQSQQSVIHRHELEIAALQAVLDAQTAGKAELGDDPPAAATVNDGTVAAAPPPENTDAEADAMHEIERYVQSAIGYRRLVDLQRDDSVPAAARARLYRAAVVTRSLATQLHRERTVSLRFSCILDCNFH